jgi:preprotein translocase subunit SecG
MEGMILIAHVLLAIVLVGLVLLQQGKGADAGASFGSGASQTVFGSRGSSNFLSSATAIIAAGLFVTSFALAIYAKKQDRSDYYLGSNCYRATGRDSSTYLG